MEDRSTEKDQYDDLASLFLPDILHPVSTENVAVKQEELEHNNDTEELVTGQSSQPKRNYDNNFSNFMSNNNFINNIGPYSQDGNIANNMAISHAGHMNHYANFVPLEAAASIQQLHHHQQHRMFTPLNPQYQQLFPSSHTQPQYSSNTMRLGSPSNSDLNWFTNPTNGIDTFAMDSRQIQNMGGSFGEFEAFGSTNPSTSQAAVPQYSNADKNASVPNNSELAEGQSVSKQADSKSKDKTKKSNAKAKKFRATPSPEVSIDYKAHKLTKLLDLKKLDNPSNDYKIVDKDDNEIQIKFQSFLNGRFFTNDTENNNYILSKLESANGEKDSGESSLKTKMDPKVISCYRRNYIQISMNMNLSGFSNDDSEGNKVLKLQNNEYGYSVTRVIKWFKVEVFANTNVSEIRNVPIIIYNDNKEKDKEKSKEEEVSDLVNPISIDTAQSTITLSDSVIRNCEIDNYYTVKKLQFKSATPNNGNLTFQNYYHLKIKVSAIVADLYYDDYIDEDYASNSYNERNEVSLFELISEPIIVRGRNPSFYADRRDILVKGRQANSKESFNLAGQGTKIEQNDAKSDQENNDIQEDNNLEAFEHHHESEKESENEEDSENETSSNKRLRSSSPSKLQPYNIEQGKLVPPLLYNATSSSSINLKSMMENTKSKLNLIPLNKSNSRYKYFPISNVYYLPPINAVYFPHRAHQQMNRESTSTNSRSSSIEKDERSANALSPQRRKNSNVYFR